QLHEVVEDPLDVVEGVRAIRVARELDLLPGAQLGEKLSSELGSLVLEPLELRLERPVRLDHFAQLANPGDDVDDGLFERQYVTGGRHRESSYNASTGRGWPPAPGSAHFRDSARLFAQDVEASHRLLFALERTRLDLFDLEPVADARQGHLAENDLARRRAGAEARARVRGVADHGVRERLRAADV